MSLLLDYVDQHRRTGCEDGSSRIRVSSIVDIYYIKLFFYFLKANGKQEINLLWPKFSTKALCNVLGRFFVGDLDINVESTTGH